MKKTIVKKKSLLNKLGLSKINKIIKWSVASLSAKTEGFIGRKKIMLWDQIQRNKILKTFFEVTFPVRELPFHGL